MINAFRKSRLIAWAGGTALGALALAAVFAFTKGSMQGSLNRLLFAALAAFVAVNIAVYVARMFAMKEYQELLLLLYEQLRPKVFLHEALPLLEKSMDSSNRCTLMAHIANGYLYSGEPEKAIEQLMKIEPPQKATEMRGLVEGNLATCHLARGDITRAKAAMGRLQSLILEKGCKKEFITKARHTLGYLSLCIKIEQREKLDPKPLRADFDSSRAPLHRLDVAYRLFLLYRLLGEKEHLEEMREFISSNAGYTCYSELIKQK